MAALTGYRRRIIGRQYSGGHNLPEAYKEVAWFEQRESYYPDGIAFVLPYTNADRIYVDAVVPPYISIENYGVIFIGNSSNGYSYSAHGAEKNNETCVFAYNKVPAYYSFDKSIRNRHIYSISSTKVSVDDEDYVGSYFQDTRHYFGVMCASNGEGGKSNVSGWQRLGRLFSAGADYQGQPIIRAYPCIRRSDNIAGLYDIITETFYPSENSARLFVGPQL